jgi:hypothetical protein
MKVIFIMVFCLSFHASAQHSFNINSNKITWQKEFETAKTFKQVLQAVKESGLFGNIDTSGQKIMMQVKNYYIDLTGAGAKRLNTTIYLIDANISGFAILEYKAGAFAVLLKNIVLTPTSGNDETGKPLEYFAIKNGMLRPDFDNKDAYILEYSLNTIFDLQN